MSDPFVSDRNDHSHSNTLSKATFNSNERVSQYGNSLLNPSAVGITKEIPSHNYETSQPMDSDNHQEEVSHYPDSRTLSSHNSGVFATHGSGASQAIAGNVDIDEPEEERGQEQGQEEENNGETTGYEADNTDLWDFEASRPTPRRPDSKRRASQLFDPPPRRSKILSPWRRSTRRLIYREEIASPSQIEIEENPQSEADEAPAPRPKPPRPSNAHSILLEMAPSPEAEFAEVNEQSFHSPSPEQQDPMSEYELHEQEQRQEQVQEQEQEYDQGYGQGYDQGYEQDDEEEYGQEYGREYDQGQDQEEQDEEQEQVSPPKQREEPVDVSEYSMLAQTENAPPSTQKKPTPAKSGIFGGFNILSFFSSPATLPTKNPETKQENTTRNTENASTSSFQKPATRGMEQVPKEPQKSLWSTGLFSSIPQKNFQPSPGGRSDLLSPAPPSHAKSNNTVQDTYESPSPAPSLSSAASPSPAPSPSPEPASSESLQQSPEPSPEPTPEQTPEPSPEMSPEPTPEMSPEVSPRPSTPDQQMYPSIAQKQNFTPRPGSSTSLFRTGPPISRNQGQDDDLLLPPSDEGDEDEDEQQETSFMTDGTEYERVPPREKPSRWDRTLSPSKSCFRSPLKPTTPGRLVTFKGSEPSPVTYPEVHVENHINGGNGSNGTLLQGSPLRQPAPVPAAVPLIAPALAPMEKQQENQSSSHAFTRNNTAPIIPSANINHSYPSLPAHKNSAFSPAKQPAISTYKNRPFNSAPPPSPARPRPQPQPQQQSHPLASTSTSTRSTNRKSSLSQTEWTRNHWLRLDEMLHLRYRDPLAFQQLIPLPPRAQRKSYDTLLGKEIRAQGERVLLETWHLEVVEGFKLEVGGWDERSLAKRVFALIIGEQRRQKAREARMRMGAGMTAA